MTDGYRDEIVTTGASLFGRRLTHGRTGNLSIRDGDRVVCTPTGSSLGALEAGRLSVVDAETGRLLEGPLPTKETFLHMALYAARPTARAVVHLHSTHAVAVSCLQDVNPSDVLPPLTAYYAMRVGKLPLLPFHAPGDPNLGPHVQDVAVRHHAMLLANHGPVVAGDDLAGAVDAIEELEETARLFLLLQGLASRPLTHAQADALR